MSMTIEHLQFPLPTSLTPTPIPIITNLVQTSSSLLWVLQQFANRGLYAFPFSVYENKGAYDPSVTLLGRTRSASLYCSYSNRPSSIVAFFVLDLDFF